MIVTKGYAVVNHSAATASLLQQVVAHVSTNRFGGLRFEPIFQAVNAVGRLSKGDKKRKSHVGHPTKKARWCEDAAKTIMNTAAEIDLHSTRSKSISAAEFGVGVLENSILQTLPGAADQVGHYDVKVRGPPSAQTLPRAVVCLTPLDRDSSLNVMPMNKLHRIPTRHEFERFRITVPVKVGQTLFMRQDMAHGGTSCPGRRLHTLLGPPSLAGHDLGYTFVLPDS